jgi:hypothetical protein
MQTLIEMAEHYAGIFSRLLTEQRKTPFVPLILNEEQKMSVYLASGVAMAFKTIDKDGVLLLLLRTSGPCGIIWNGRDFLVQAIKQ